VRITDNPDLLLPDCVNCIDCTAANAEALHLLALLVVHSACAPPPAPTLP
jgi:hypothetical protein